MRLMQGKRFSVRGRQVEAKTLWSPQIQEAAYRDWAGLRAVSDLLRRLSPSLRTTLERLSLKFQLDRNFKGMSPAPRPSWNLIGGRDTTLRLLEGLLRKHSPRPAGAAGVDPAGSGA